MTGIPPQFIALFCIMFIALGIFNILTARRRQQRSGLQGVHLPWYRQVTILTGIEYILLASVFLLSLGITYKVVPVSLNSVVIPFFLILMLASGLLAGFVIYQSFTNMQRRRTLVASGAQMTPNGHARIANNGSTQKSGIDDMSPQERATYTQKRRERRQKAASARRRKAGRA